MKIPGFTAELGLGKPAAYRLEPDGDAGSTRAPLVPQFGRVAGFTDFEPCQLVCIPDRFGAGVTCSRLCHPNAALVTHFVEGLL
jgi:hypothetical protein